MKRLGKLLVSSGVCLGLLALSVTCCITNSETNRSALILVSDSQMNQMGRQSYKELIRSENLSKNSKQTAAVVRVGRRIAKASGQKFDWEFKLIENKKMINAFCLPGGKIAVYTGILPIAKTEAGLAAIMGHEVAHAVLRHGAERISQNIAAQAGLSLAGLTLTDRRYRGLVLAGLGLGAQVGILLPFSRKHEEEADQVGLKYMAKAGYDPAESVDLWLRMADASGRKVPEILSTHPDPKRRAKNLKNMLSKVSSDYAQSEKQAKRLL